MADDSSLLTHSEPSCAISYYKYEHTAEKFIKATRPSINLPQERPSRTPTTQDLRHVQHPAHRLHDQHTCAGLILQAGSKFTDLRQFFKRPIKSGVFIVCIAGLRRYCVFVILSNLFHRTCRKTNFRHHFCVGNITSTNSRN